MGYYNCKNPVKNIKSAIEILTNIKDETVDIEQLITFQYLMYNKFRCKYEELKEAEGLFEMRLPAFEESLRKREEKGIEKGMKKGGIIANLNNAIRMFDENVSTKDVIKFTRIPEENAQYISSLSGNGYTHNEILDFVLKKFYPNLTN